jgi:hypothetical protein
MREYIRQQDIRFDRYDILWLLEILPELRGGKYPLSGAGPMEGPAGRGRGPHAPFESVEMLAAEVDDRLKACGRDGVLLEACYTLEIPLEKAALLLGEPTEKTSKRLDSALKYISSGWCRRWIACDRCWRREVCVRAGKGRTPKTYADWRGHR